MHICVYIFLCVYLRLFIILKDINVIKAVVIKYVFIITPEELQRINSTLLYITLHVSYMAYKYFEII